MRVFYRSRPGRFPHGPEIVYEQVGAPAFCCAEMERHWGTMIGFGVRGSPRSTSREVNVWTRMPQAHGLAIWGLAEVAYCPWCGEAVETCRVK